MEDLVLQERYDLVMGRIAEIAVEKIGNETFEEYFERVAKFLLLLDETGKFIQAGGLKTAPIEELKERNTALYADVFPENYEDSYANPAVAVKKLGDEYGREFSWLYVKMRSLIADIYRGSLEDVVAGMELFVEVYGTVAYGISEGKLPTGKEIRDILYWFSSDYADRNAETRVREMVCPDECFEADIIMNSDLFDIRYLFAYGDYVSENEIETAKYLASLPEETIHTMADTYTEGFRIGFEVTGKDLSKKKTVNLRYALGFERMMKRAIENFAKLGLKVVIGRNSVSGGAANRQYQYDHKDDIALFLDKNYMNRRIDVLKTAFEQYKEDANGHAGPAVQETFGEADFDPVNKPENIRFTEEQNKLWVEFLTKNGAVMREYIIPEERSFTIIAFPVPEIGPVFKELFDETIRLNTLDYMLYRNVQQTIIDALDTADYCEIKGMGDNRTDLKVNLWKLQDPAKETIFENCVADVNIPVGEVFTSPVLEGTNGVLHVTKVFLNGLEYRDLSVTFKDGMIADYNCSNFDTEEENKAFVKENILFRHDTLPIGEFAIGTNTTAYVMARRLGVEAKLPILIAEKTGPHFAVGDTCYSHTEDVKVYNPDGKEIVARDNSVSLLRKTDPSKAYLNCHTDITIPYDELGELTAVRKDGSRVVIIQNGRFVLPGTEPLNEAFEN
ncbi:MAG: aminopeptidase [Acetatifactor sp.]|nr:aminopeptidase [Acetatifactor sp.]